MKKRVYEILVPTKFGDTNKRIPTKLHKEWDKLILPISGGLTILRTGKGQWVHQGTCYKEHVIPVRIICSPKDMRTIMEITLRHFKQKAVACFQVSEKFQILYA